MVDPLKMVERLDFWSHFDDQCRKAAQQLDLVGTSRLLGFEIDYILCFGTSYHLE